MIEVKDLTRVYGNHKAVDSISFTVEDGKIYGFLGPNGAGKSTTMNMITGCLSITSGQILINGFDIFEEPEKAKKCIGYLPEIPPLYTDMTPYEYLMFAAGAKGVKRSQRKNAVLKSIEATGLNDMKDRLIKNLSKGYRQRVGIAQAIVSEPEIIILDEPTVGLDPIQIIEIRDLIKSLAKDHTVIISSHILSEIRAVCDDVIIINKGKIIACDSIENLENTLKGKLDINIEAKASFEQIKEILEGFDVTFKEEENGYVKFSVFAEGDEKKVMENIFNVFARAQKPIVSMSRQKADLENIFVEMTEKEEKNDSDL